MTPRRESLGATAEHAPADVRDRHVPWAGHAAMFVFAVLVGGSFSIGRLAANDITPEALTALRFVLAFGLIGGLAAWQNRRRPGATARAARAPWRYVLLGGSLGFYFVMMFYGLKTAAPVSASAVFTLTPLMAAGFGFLLVGQRMGPAMAGALGLGAFGALWVIFRGDLGAAMALDIGRGEIYYFIGCVSHALYTPLVARLNRGETAVTFSAGMIGVGAVMLLALAARDLWVLDWAGMPMRVWGALVYLGVFTSAVTFVLL